MTTALAIRKERALLRQERALARGPTPVPSPGRPPTIDLVPVPAMPTQPPSLSYSGGDSLVGIAGAAASIPSSMLQGVGATVAAGVANWANTPLVDFGGAIPWESGRGKKKRSGEVEAIVHLNNGHILAGLMLLGILRPGMLGSLVPGAGGAGGGGENPAWSLLKALFPGLAVAEIGMQRK